jgi:hypothetical protein
MEKLDLTKVHKSYYSAKTKPQLLEIEAADYLSICGKGDPSSENFMVGIQALYSVAYAIKFAFKAKGRDFVVPKLEGLWWFDTNLHAVSSAAGTPVEVPRSEWEWRLLLRLPRYVKEEDIQMAKQHVTEKKQLPRAANIEPWHLDEQLVVQMLHVGPFETEPETIRQIVDYMNANGLEKAGEHHEIYLSDFRKTAPEKLKTILREPTKRIQTN